MKLILGSKIVGKRGKGEPKIKILNVVNSYCKVRRFVTLSLQPWLKPVVGQMIKKITVLVILEADFIFSQSLI